MKGNWSVQVLAAVAFVSLLAGCGQEEPAEGQQLIRAACQPLLDSASFYYTRHVNMESQFALDSAILYYRRSVACDSQSIAAHMYLAAVLAGKRDTQAVLALADRVVQLGKHDPGYLCYRAGQRMWAGDTAGARTDLQLARKAEDQLLAAHPDSIVTGGATLAMMELLYGKDAALATGDSLLRLYPRQLLLRYTVVSMREGPTNVPDSLVKEVEAYYRSKRPKADAGLPMRQMLTPLM